MEIPMELIWFAAVVVLMTTLVCLVNSTSKSKWLRVDNNILQKLKDTTNNDWITIVKNCEADKFEIKQEDEMTRKEKKEYYKSIEQLFESIKSKLRSTCAQRLIDQRYYDIDYIMKVEEHCKSKESCQKCGLRTMKRQLK